jgi:hypothetical protein
MKLMPMCTATPWVEQMVQEGLEQQQCGRCFLRAIAKPIAGAVIRGSVVMEICQLIRLATKLYQ